MDNESGKSDALLAEFERMASRLNELLDDIAWRKPDVENEEAKLAELRERAKTDPETDVATQAIVVRVLRGVLDDKVAEADRLEKRILELKAILEAAQVKK